MDPAVWGRGYATEGGRAIVAEAFERLARRASSPGSSPRTRRSLSVCAALGLTAERDAVGRFGEPVRVLRLTNLHKPD